MSAFCGQTQPHNSHRWTPDQPGTFTLYRWCSGVSVPQTDLSAEVTSLQAVIARVREEAQAAVAENRVASPDSYEDGACDVALRILRVLDAEQ